MAKHSKRRRRRFNLRRVRCTPELNLGTLASDTALTTPMSGGTATAPMRVVSVKATVNANGITAANGPFTVGYAHGDYSVTEIKECLEAAAALDIGNKISIEHANRLVRIIGTIDAEDSRLNDGKPITTRLNWFFPSDKKLNFFAFNESTSAADTGASIKVAGDMWVKD